MLWKSNFVTPWWFQIELCAPASHSTVTKEVGSHFLYISLFLSFNIKTNVKKYIPSHSSRRWYDARARLEENHRIYVKNMTHRHWSIHSPNVSFPLEHHTQKTAPLLPSVHECTKTLEKKWFFIEHNWYFWLRINGPNAVLTYTIWISLWTFKNIRVYVCACLCTHVKRTYDNF